jgi:hypothetical protein
VHLTQQCRGAAPAPTPSLSSRKTRYHRTNKKDKTYGLITCLIRPERIEEPNQTRLVAGGNRVLYRRDAGTPAADLLTVKLHINSTISTPNAKYMTIGIKDFFLNTPMDQYEYMRLQIVDMHDDLIKHYNITDLTILDGYVYCEIQKPSTDRNHCPATA